MAGNLCTSRAPAVCVTQRRPARHCARGCVRWLGILHFTQTENSGDAWRPARVYGQGCGACKCGVPLHSHHSRATHCRPACFTCRVVDRLLSLSTSSENARVTLRRSARFYGQTCGVGLPIPLHKGWPGGADCQEHDATCTYDVQGCARVLEALCTPRVQ